MARKTLLTESEIRRFMKLANMGTVGNQLEGLYPGARDEEEYADGLPPEEGLPPEGEELEVGGLDVEEDPMPVPEPEPDMGMDTANDTVSLSDFVTALEQAVEEVTGQPTSADLDTGEEEEEAPLEGGDELAAEMPEEPVAELPVEDEEELEYAMQEQLVNKIAKRVAARLVKENKKAQLAEKLTERIFNRLTSK